MNAPHRTTIAQFERAVRALKEENAAVEGMEKLALDDDCSLSKSEVKEAFATLHKQHRNAVRHSRLHPADCQAIRSVGFERDDELLDLPVVEIAAAVIAAGLIVVSDFPASSERTSLAGGAP